jgi:hypothetical protein
MVATKDETKKRNFRERLNPQSGGAATEGRN